MLDIDRINPATYAERLAGYIADPSTIRARTLESYGRAPSIAEIEKMRAKRFPVKVEKPQKPWPCGHPRSDENSAWVTLDREACKTCYDALQAGIRTKREQERELARQDAAKRAEMQARAVELENAIAEREALDRRIAILRTCTFGDELISGVAYAFNLAPILITGQSREPWIVAARSVIARIMHSRGQSFPQIGRRLNRDHTTIMHMLNTWEKRARRFPDMERIYEALK